MIERCFFDFLKNQNISNIRVINRIIGKLCPIFKLHEENTNKNILINLDEIIISISSAIVAAYVHNKKYEDFISFCDISTLNDNALDAQSMSVRTLMQSAIGYNTRNLLPYVFNMKSLEDIKHFLFEDIWHPTPRDIALSRMPHFSEIDEDVLVTVLVALIKKDDEVDIKEWIRSVNNYKFLVDGAYIYPNTDLTDDFIKIKSEEFSDDELNSYFEGGSGDIGTDLYMPRPSGLAAQVLYERYVNSKSVNSLEIIVNDLIQHGWGAFDKSRIEKLGGNSQFKPLELIGYENIVLCIWRNKWSVEDIEKFTYYLNDLYNFSNISEFLSGEITPLQKLESKLELYKNLKRNSFRYGAIIKLLRTIESILKRLV
jgi:hypothetical protein